MTKFEKVLAKFGLAYRSRLVLATENKDIAVKVSGSLMSERDEALGRLSFVAAENVRLRAEIKQMRLTPGEKQTLANHRLRVLREVADRVAA
ncbi:MAG: hypothetical protein IPQ22_16865 [Rhodoferax sp.]|nr:hypothetical protein [Rhodoferax sp.]